MTNSKQDFQNHLARLGFDFSRNPPAILQRLRAKMGEARFGQYLSVVNSAKDGDSYNQIYDFMNDLVEANLLRSMSPDVTLDASYRLYERSFAHLRPGAKLLELGCWTGGLASFIAMNHPGCSVVGVDRAQRIIDQDKAHFTSPNLAFRVWDYRQPKPQDMDRYDLLLCCLGININFPLGAYKQIDPLAFRSAPAYQAEKAELLPYFSNWRAAAKDGAKFLAVIRMASFPRFLALLDASNEAGWKALLDESETIVSPTTTDLLPLLSFSATAGEPIDETLALSHWMKLMQNTHHLISLSEGVAIGMYRSLNRQALSTRDFTTEEGFAAHEEIGTAGPMGYIYMHTSRPSHRLDLVTLSAIQQRVKAAGR